MFCECETCVLSKKYTICDAVVFMFNTTIYLSIIYWLFLFSIGDFKAAMGTWKSDGEGILSGKKGAILISGSKL